MSRTALPDLSIFPADSYDMIALLDVLEHVPDDKGSLAAIFTRLKPGGALLLTVPANPWMWSAHDVAHHHHRRYRKGEIAALAKEAGFEIDLLSPFNTMLFPLIAGVRLLNKVRGHDSADDALPPKPVNAPRPPVRRRSRAYRPIAVSVRRISSRGAAPAGALAEQQRPFGDPHRLPARDPRPRDRRHVDQPQIIERVARDCAQASFDRHALAAAAFGAHHARRIALEPAGFGIAVVSRLDPASGHWSLAKPSRRTITIDGRWSLRRFAQPLHGDHTSDTTRAPIGTASSTPSWRS